MRPPYSQSHGKGPKYVYPIILVDAPFKEVRYYLEKRMREFSRKELSGFLCWRCDQECLVYYTCYRCKNRKEFAYKVYPLYHYTMRAYIPFLELDILRLTVWGPRTAIIGGFRYEGYEIDPDWYFITTILRNSSFYSTRFRRREGDYELNLTYLILRSGPSLFERLKEETSPFLNAELRDEKLNCSIEPFFKRNAT